MQLYAKSESDVTEFKTKLAQPKLVQTLSKAWVQNVKLTVYRLPVTLQVILWGSSPESKQSHNLGQ